jgi:hypothetical protein
MTRSLKENIDTHWKHVEALVKRLGVTDIYKALRAVEKLLRRNEELQGYIDEVCSVTRTDNIGNALKRIKTTPVGDSVFLPDKLQRIPQLWLEGRAETRKHKGVLKLTFYQAESRYRRLKPYLEDAWRIAGQRDNEIAELLREQILEKYEDCSPDEMTKFCYAIEHNYDLTEEEDVREEKTEEASIAELMRIVNRSNFDYGVISKEQISEEQQ